MQPTRDGRWVIGLLFCLPAVLFEGGPHFGLLCLEGVCGQQGLRGRIGGAQQSKNVLALLTPA